MNKQHHLIKVPLVLVCLFLRGCEKSSEQCVTCSKETVTGWYGGGWIGVRTDKKEACGENEVKTAEADGWKCDNFLVDFDHSYKILINPSDKSNFEPLDAVLEWRNPRDINGKSTFPDYYIYFGNESNPTNIVNKDQLIGSNEIGDYVYQPMLIPNKTYYWKVIAKVLDFKYESEIKSFTTAPGVIAYGSVTDSRDGHTYKTVKIGAQTWMAENLAYEIPGKQITDASEWFKNSAFEGWCYYNNDKASFGEIYGILYQWKSAQESCPEGWHLPSNDEWKILIEFLGSYPGRKLKEEGYNHWEEYPDPHPGLNTTGFTALPGGLRHNKFDEIGKYGNYWTSSQVDIVQGFYKRMSYASNYDINNIGNGKTVGYSVRCIKN